jgi:hypothetical protein
MASVQLNILNVISVLGVFNVYDEGKNLKKARRGAFEIQYSAITHNSNKKRACVCHTCISGGTGFCLGNNNLPTF